MKKVMSLWMVLVLILVGCGAETNNDETIAVEATTTALATDKATEAPETSEAATEPPAEPVDIKVIAPYGTPALSIVQMVTENPTIGDNVIVTYELIGATDVLTAELINGNADFAIVPTNLAAVLYSKEAGYQLAGSSVMGSLYVASTEDITSIEDLRGKTIGTFGRNLTPDAVFRYVLTANDINPDEDLTLNYFAAVSEVSANYIGEQTNVAMLAQPVLTAASMKREGTQTVIDLQEEWTKATGLDGFPQASIVVSESFAAEHPELVDAFLASYDLAVDWVNANPTEAGAYYEALNIGLKAPIVQKAIPFCNLDYRAVSENKELFDGYLTALYEFNPKLTGGAPVEDGLYYLK